MSAIDTIGCHQRGPVGVDAEKCLADRFVGEGVGAGVEAGSADVAGEPFEFVAPTERGSADHIAGEVDDAHRRGRRSPLGGEDVDGPRRAVVGAVDPVGGEAIELGSCCCEFEVHLGDACLHERVMVQGAGRDRDRRGPLAVLDRELHRPFGDADVDVADQA